MSIKDQIDKILDKEIRPQLINDELIPGIGDRGKWNHIILSAARKATPTQELLDKLNNAMSAFESGVHIREILDDLINFLN